MQYKRRQKPQQQVRHDEIMDVIEELKSTSESRYGHSDERDGRELRRQNSLIVVVVVAVKATGAPPSGLHVGVVVPFAVRCAFHSFRGSILLSCPRPFHIFSFLSSSPSIHHLQHEFAFNLHCTMRRMVSDIR